MSNGKIRIFLSHASEDKDDFVRPLAEGLREEFEVWYDEYSLLVGPSLLGQISKGLRQCQYGIVVLSKHFFEKKWPRSELDGLFDLEPADQSLILPIWHGVTHEEVSQFSPILASRGATRSELGIPRVVSDLKRSIDAGERTKQISSPVGRHILAYQETAGAKRNTSNGHGHRKELLQCGGNGIELRKSPKASLRRTARQDSTLPTTSPITETGAPTLQSQGLRSCWIRQN